MSHALYIAKRNNKSLFTLLIYNTYLLMQLSVELTGETRRTIHIYGFCDLYTIFRHHQNQFIIITRVNHVSIFLGQYSYIM